MCGWWTKSSSTGSRPHGMNKKCKSAYKVGNITCLLEQNENTRNLTRFTPTWVSPGLPISFWYLHYYGFDSMWKFVEAHFCPRNPMRVEIQCKLYTVKPCIQANKNYEVYPNIACVFFLEDPFPQYNNHDHGCDRLGTGTEFIICRPGRTGPVFKPVERDFQPPGYSRAITATNLWKKSTLLNFQNLGSRRASLSSESDAYSVILKMRNFVFRGQRECRQAKRQLQNHA